MSHGEVTYFQQVIWERDSDISLVSIYCVVMFSIALRVNHALKSSQSALMC